LIWINHTIMKTRNFSNIRSIVHDRVYSNDKKPNVDCWRTENYKSSHARVTSTSTAGILPSIPLKKFLACSHVILQHFFAIRILQRINFGCRLITHHTIFFRYSIRIHITVYEVIKWLPNRTEFNNIVCLPFVPI